MRCPSCEYIFADEKDICPKCIVDIRAYKARVGLPITNKTASSRELVESVLKDQSLKNKPHRQRPSIINLINPLKNKNSQIEDNNIKQKLSLYEKLGFKKCYNKLSSLRINFKNTLTDKIKTKTQESKATQQTLENPTKTNIIEVTTPTSSIVNFLNTTVDLDQPIKLNSLQLNKKLEAIKLSKKIAPEVLEFESSEDLIKFLEIELPNFIKEKQLKNKNIEDDTNRRTH